MNDIAKLFPSKYLKPEDLAGSEVTVTIANVAVEEIGQSKDRKALLALVGITKWFVLNKTNVNAIGKLHGPNFAGWIGKQIVLYRTTTSFGGETVDCIRVKAPPAGGAPPAAAPAPPAPAAPAKAAR